jgi:hypothetical protein
MPQLCSMPIGRTVRGWLGLNVPEPAVMQASPGVPLAVCECNAWRGFMVEVLYPDATRISVEPGDQLSRLVSAVPASARGVLVHLNASTTRGFIADPEGLRAKLAQRGQRVLNLDADDVRKSTLHAQCEALGLASVRATAVGPEDERVIVKTVLNYGGGPERGLRDRWGERAASLTSGIHETMQGSKDYIVCRRDQVPASTWSDPSLVVERFVENPEGLIFRAYQVGPAAVVSAVWVAGDIKKLSVGIRRRLNYFFWTVDSGETVAMGPTTAQAREVARVTREIAGAMHFDFVAADCVMDSGGTIYITDVNKTPYWGEPRQSPVLAHVRHGFDAAIGDFT